MIRGRVLVIDGDEWASNALVRALKERGLDVSAATEAVPGFRLACETSPDVIVLNTELPDIDGVWVARRIRMEAGLISKVPILFVGELTDRDIRTTTLNAGADMFLLRPVTNEEIVAQVCALIAMARRFENPVVEDAPPSSRSVAAAIRGDLSAFPLASMLMMFEMERRSGFLQVTSESGTRASIALSGGLFSSTEIDGAQRPALEVLRAVLAWRAGRFSFQPRDSGALPPPRASVGALVLEAMRLEDEEKNPQKAPPIEFVDDLEPQSDSVIVRTSSLPPNSPAS